MEMRRKKRKSPSAPAHSSGCWLAANPLSSYRLSAPDVSAVMDRCLIGSSLLSSVDSAFRDRWVNGNRIRLEDWSGWLCRLPFCVFRRCAASSLAFGRVATCVRLARREFHPARRRAIIDTCVDAWRWSCSHLNCIDVLVVIRSIGGCTVAVTILISVGVDAVWNAVDGPRWARFSRVKRWVGIGTLFFDHFRRNKLQIVQVDFVQLTDGAVKVRHVLRVAHRLDDFPQLVDVRLHRLLSRHLAESLPGIIFRSARVLKTVGISYSE